MYIEIVEKNVTELSKLLNNSIAPTLATPAHYNVPADRT